MGKTARWTVLLPLLAASLAGCATARRVPTPEELGRVRAVDVRAIAAGTVVRHAAAKDPAVPGEARPVPRIELDPDTERAVADAIVGAGPCETSLPLRHAAGPADGAASAAVEVKVLSVALASGAGPDPLTALWARFSARVALPAEGASGRGAPRWLDPAESVAVDPRPRPLSEWLADGGAKVRAGVAALAAQHAPRLLADLRGAPPAAPCAHLAEAVAAGGTGAGGGEPQAAAPAAEPELATSVEAAPPVPIEFHSTAGSSPGRVAASTVGGVVIGVVAGTFVGAALALGTCAKTLEGMRGGGGVGFMIGIAIFGACSIVAVPVAAGVGALVGIGQGGSRGHAAAVKHEAAVQAERHQKASGLWKAPLPAAIAAGVETSNQALADGGDAAEGSPPAIGVARVRLLEDGGDPPVSRLELELTVAATGERDRPARRVCLRGPGAVPTELWVDRDAALLRGSIEAQLARGVALARAGAAAQPGEGPCPAVEAKPDPAGRDEAPAEAAAPGAPIADARAEPAPDPGGTAAAEAPASAGPVSW